MLYHLGFKERAVKLLCHLGFKERVIKLIYHLALVVITEAHGKTYGAVFPAFPDLPRIMKSFMVTLPWASQLSHIGRRPSVSMLKQTVRRCSARLTQSK